MKRFAIVLLLISALAYGIWFLFFQNFATEINGKNDFQLISENSIALFKDQQFTLSNTEAPFLKDADYKIKTILEDYPDNLLKLYKMPDSSFYQIIADSNLYLKDINYENQQVYLYKHRSYFTPIAEYVLVSDKRELLLNNILKIRHSADLNSNKEFAKALKRLDKNESFALYKHIKWEGFDYYANQNKGFGFIDGKKYSIPGDFLNYIPIDAGNFYISQDSISFEWQKRNFLIRKNYDTEAFASNYTGGFNISNEKNISGKYSAKNAKVIAECMQLSALKDLIDKHNKKQVFGKLKNNLQQISLLSTFQQLTPSLKQCLGKKFENKLLIAEYTGKSEDFSLIIDPTKKATVASTDNNNNNVTSGTISKNFDHDIIWGPYLVNNHRENSPCILIQLSDKTLHLISSDGKDLWQRQLDNPILNNKVIEVDRYNNNKVQYLLNTKTRIYQLDVLGRNVSGFPIRINSTSAVEFVDYSKKKRRILVGNSRSLKNYTIEGKVTRGWNVPKLKKPIRKIKYQKLRNKDLICVQDESNKWSIYNPTGGMRLENKCNTHYSESGIYFENPSVLTDHSLFFVNEKNNLSLGTLYPCQSQELFDKEVNQIIFDDRKVLVSLAKEIYLLDFKGHLIKQVNNVEKSIVVNKHLLYKKNDKYFSINKNGDINSIEYSDSIIGVDSRNTLLTWTKDKKLFISTQ